MVIANIISYVLVLLGAVNWGLYGIFDFNLVSWIFQGPRSVGSIIVYVIITLAAIWLIISPIISGFGLRLRMGDKKRRETEVEAQIVLNSKAGRSFVKTAPLSFLFAYRYCKIKNFCYNKTMNDIGKKLGSGEKSFGRGFNKRGTVLLERPRLLQG